MRDFNWLLTRFANDTPGVEYAQCLGRRRLVSGRSRPASIELHRSRLAATQVGLRSPADGPLWLVNQHAAHQVIVELHTSFFFVTAIGDGSALGIVDRESADMGQIGYEIALLVEQPDPLTSRCAPS
ncbi:MAG: hypothetical protein R2705_11950 [Ilumatobacteraceae bacterium]